jgi:ribosomal protein L28
LSSTDGDGKDARHVRPQDFGKRPVADQASSVITAGTKDERQRSSFVQVGLPAQCFVTGRRLVHLVGYMRQVEQNARVLAVFSPGIEWDTSHTIIASTSPFVKMAKRVNKPALHAKKPSRPEVRNRPISLLVCTCVVRDVKSDAKRRSWRKLSSAGQLCSMFFDDIVGDQADLIAHARVCRKDGAVVPLQRLQHKVGKLACRKASESSHIFTNRVERLFKRVTFLHCHANEGFRLRLADAERSRVRGTLYFIQSE